MKTTTTKTTTKVQSSLPMHLMDNEKFRALEKSGLKLIEREIVAIHLMINNIGGSAQSKVSILCDTGKQGQTSIISIATWLKTQGEDTATLKVQVNRAMSKLNTGLSLQGLGKDQIPFIGPKQAPKGGASGEGEGEGDTDTTLVVQYDNDSFDQDSFDIIFNDWDTETQAYFIEHCIKLKAKALKAQAKK